jgi:3-oxoadipate enol-lactonase
VPTLVIAGEEDRVTPPQESKILANCISDSTLSLIPGAGHFSMLENPVAFNSILRRFLDGLPCGAS